jgi:hypothetical protein
MCQGDEKRSGYSAYSKNACRGIGSAAGSIKAVEQEVAEFGEGIPGG